MTLANDLNRLIQAHVQDAAAVELFGNGVVEAVEGYFAAVRLGANERATPSFSIPPRLSVAVGDHVLVFRRGGYQLILEVLNRNATLGPDRFDSVEGAAEYLAQQKLGIDTYYRLRIGLDTLDRPKLEAGGGGEPMDVELVRSDVGEWTMAPTLAVGRDADVALRLVGDRAWRFEQRVGTAGEEAALQLRPETEDKSTHLTTSDGSIIATFRDEATFPRLSFFGAAPAAKPTITGSKGGNAALTSAIAALVALGLVNDATT